MSVCLNSKITKRGFTIIEAIVAIFVITTGIVGVLALVTQTISSATYSSNKLIAAYLAQEGIEIVRNVRDANWLSDASWGTGLTDCSSVSPCQADYNDQALSGYTNSPLNFETISGYYGYDSGTSTKFKRKITITSANDPDGNPILNVFVLVEWQEKDKPQKVEVRENLYDWK